MPQTPPDVVERQVRIAARPETVFPFLVDPAKMIQWAGGLATLDARPGGIYRLASTDGWVQRGEFIEIVPNQRVVYSMGWEDEGAPFAPGLSRVEISLIPDGEGTILRLRHFGVPAEHRESHGQGWDYFLPRIQAAAEVRDPGANPWAGPVLQKEVRVRARPAEIFPLFTDPSKMKQWMGVECRAAPHPGGEYFCNVTGRDRVGGEFLEVVAPSRVVHTWGWYSQEGAPPTRWSTIEVSLTADGPDTLVQMRQYCLSEEGFKGHQEGWDHYFPRLVEVAEGRAPGPDPWAILPQNDSSDTK